jgi:hypothetical protein
MEAMHWAEISSFDHVTGVLRGAPFRPIGTRRAAWVSSNTAGVSDRRARPTGSSTPGKVNG